jgi:hypothetical protein
MPNRNLAYSIISNLNSIKKLANKLRDKKPLFVQSIFVVISYTLLAMTFSSAKFKAGSFLELSGSLEPFLLIQIIACSAIFSVFILPENCERREKRKRTFWLEILLLLSSVFSGSFLLEKAVENNFLYALLLIVGIGFVVLPTLLIKVHPEERFHFSKGFIFPLLVLVPQLILIFFGQRILNSYFPVQNSLTPHNLISIILVIVLFIVSAFAVLQIKKNVKMRALSLCVFTVLSAILLSLLLDLKNVYQNTHINYIETVISNQLPFDDTKEFKKMFDNMISISSNKDSSLNASISDLSDLLKKNNSQNDIALSNALHNVEAKINTYNANSVLAPLKGNFDKLMNSLTDKQNLIRSLQDSLQKKQNENFNKQKYGITLIIELQSQIKRLSANDQVNLMRIDSLQSLLNSIKKDRDALNSKLAAIQNKADGKVDALNKECAMLKDTILGRFTRVVLNDTVQKKLISRNLENIDNSLSSINSTLKESLKKSHMDSVLSSPPVSKEVMVLIAKIDFIIKENNSFINLFSKNLSDVKYALDFISNNLSENTFLWKTIDGIGKDLLPQPQPDSLKKTLYRNVLVNMYLPLNNALDKDSLLSWSDFESGKSILTNPDSLKEEIIRLCNERKIVKGDQIVVFGFADSRPGENWMLSLKRAQYSAELVTAWAREQNVIIEVYSIGGGIFDSGLNGRIIDEHRKIVLRKVKKEVKKGSSSVLTRFLNIFGWLRPN